MLQVGDDLRHRGLRHPQLDGGLGKAPRLYNREQHAQVPQPQTPPDLIVPIGDFWHKRWLWSIKTKKDFCLYFGFPIVAIMQSIMRASSSGEGGGTMKLVRRQFLRSAAARAFVPALSQMAWAQAYP